MDNDHLTGLLPLHLFILEADYILANNPHRRYAVTATDLSNFKYINNLYGMEEGDQTIIDMADTLFISNPRCVLASRPYADQFRALIDLGSTTQEQECEIIQSMNNDLIKRLQQRYHNIYLHIYTGLYMIEDNSEEVRNACDKAHFAKKCIKGNLAVNYGLFNPRAYEDSNHTIECINAFQHAKSRNKILVYMQPKVSASTGELVGAEALGRMLDRNGALMSPGEFMPALEQTGIIGEFDNIIMDMTFSTIRRWIDNQMRVVPVSVNISRMQFLKPGLVDRIVSCQEKYGIPADLIEIEITETTFINDIDLISSISGQLRSHGFHIDVDDFGSGYSSLSLISTLPADIVKLDCSFARKCLDNEKGISILSNLIQMLKDIGFDLVCEGIETNEQKELIEKLGCDKIQGFFYDKPLPIDEFEKKYMYQ
jgi:EAL domain-containing protein (putative c-di-GMP-specific phosphodiesterase class I)